MKQIRTAKRDETNSSADERRERRSYLYGAAIALVLTLLAFATVRWKILPPATLVGAVGILAIIQMVVHFRFFLHIRLKRNRADLHLIAFSGLILLIMVAGTVWIMSSLALRMTMTMPP
jgi:cytochrome o ubiquinol oxidase operon protein cyoD